MYARPEILASFDATALLAEARAEDGGSDTAGYP